MTTVVTIELESSVIVTSKKWLVELCNLILTSKNAISASNAGDNKRQFGKWFERGVKEAIFFKIEKPTLNRGGGFTQLFLHFLAVEAVTLTAPPPALTLSIQLLTTLKPGSSFNQLLSNHSSLRLNPSLWGIYNSALLNLDLTKTLRWATKCFHLQPTSICLLWNL